MFTSRDFLRGDYNVLSKNVTRDVSQSEKTLSESYNNTVYLRFTNTIFTLMKSHLHYNTRYIIDFLSDYIDIPKGNNKLD